MIVVKTEIIIKPYNKDPVEFLKDFERHQWFDLQLGIYNIAHKACDFMVQYIIRHKVRPQIGETKLENNITADTIDDVNKIIMGIGNIDRLEKNAPYWRILDQGGIANTGHWVPRGAFINGGAKPPIKDAFHGRWVTKTGKWSFIARRPIVGIKYIENTVEFIRTELDKLIRSVHRIKLE